MFVHVRVPKVGGKVSILKIPVAQVPPVRLAAILEKLSTPSHLLAFSVRTGRNIRTQFLYDNSIYPTAARQQPREVHWLYRNGLYRYIRTPTSMTVSRTFYSANGQTLFVHTVGNSRPNKESCPPSVNSFREYLAKRAASRRFMKINRSAPSEKFCARDIPLSSFEMFILKYNVFRATVRCLVMFKLIYLKFILLCFSCFLFCAVMLNE